MLRFGRLAGLIAILMLALPTPQTTEAAIPAYRKAAPQPTPKGQTLTGRASWYGPRFQGKRTSSGERFNQYHATLACRSLALGTRVRITNLENGRTCGGRVNDRGPYVKGRKFDVSRSIARQLGFVHQGTAKLKIETMKKGGK